MDISEVVAEELRVTLKGSGRNLPPEALLQVGAAFKAARAVVGSDALYETLVTRVAKRLAGERTLEATRVRSRQARADRHFRARFPQYFEDPKPAPVDDTPVFTMRHPRFVL